MKRTGLSLVEILIAMAVLTILVTAVAYAVTGMMNITRDSRITSAAADYAQAVVERYRTYWRDPSNYFDASVATDPDYPAYYATVPDISDLANKLISDGGSSYHVIVDPHEMLNPDGTAFTSADKPPARRLRVTVEQPTGRIRVQLSTIIGPR